MTRGYGVSGPLAPPRAGLTDGEVELAPLARMHLAPLAALGSDPLVQRFTRVPETFGTKEAEWWLGLYERGWGDGSRAGFAILERPGGAFVGMIAFVTLRLDTREAEVGYIVAPEARGRGIAGRALSLLTGWGLGELGLARIELRAELANPASLKVAERCGYVREGTMRNVHLKSGRRGDMALFSRIAGDSGA
jgi:RimJ/RimL family protein N-acetyltransferase